MKARRYKIKLIGETPLLMHQDNLSWAEIMKKWALDPANKKGSIAGDDRSPAWRWFGNLYIENNTIVMPADNLMTMLREGGKRCPTGKGQMTFKAQTQSGIVVDQGYWPLVVGDKGDPISVAALRGMLEEEDFSKHEEAVKALGFELFVKRAKISQAKHVRVRPRFDNWSCEGSITVLDDQITTDVIRNIVTFAGVYAGLGDWRPSSPKSPGPYGKFNAEVKEF
jgi:hypothetical protein